MAKAAVRPATAKPKKPPAGAKPKKVKAEKPGPITLGATGLRVKSAAQALAVSPDGSQIATGDGKGYVRVVDAVTGAQLVETRWRSKHAMYDHGIQHLAFSPDGAVISGAVGIGGHGDLFALHIASGVTWFEGAEYRAYAYAPDSRTIAGVGMWRETGIHLVDARDGTASATIALPAETVAWTRDGTRIVARTHEGEPKQTAVHVIDAETHVVLARHEVEGDLSGWSFDVVGDEVVMVGLGGEPDKRVTRLDLGTGRCDTRTVTGELASGSSYASVLPSRGEVVFVATSDASRVAELATARVTQTLPPDTQRVAASADGAVAATSHGMAVRLWDRTWQERSAAPGLSTKVTAIGFSADGTTVITCDELGVKLWGLDAGLRASFALGDGWELAPDGNAALVARADTTIVIDLPSGTPRGSGIAGRYGGAMSADATLVASRTSDRGHVTIRSLVTGEVVRTLAISPGDTVYGMAFSPDGALLATGSWNRVAHVHEVETGNLRHSLQAVGGYGQMAFEFSPDGTQLASGDTCRTVRIWQLPRHELKILKGHRRKYIRAITFSPDATRLASIDEADTRLWDVATGTQLGIARTGGHSLAFSPDGTRLAVGGEGTAWIYEVASFPKK